MKIFLKPGHGVLKCMRNKKPLPNGNGFKNIIYFLNYLSSMDKYKNHYIRDKFLRALLYR